MKGMITLELRQIKYFFYSCKYMNFSKAAHELCITQPNLTMQIKKLEKEVQTELFTRTKPIALTMTGEILFKHCKKIISEINDTQRELEDALCRSNLLKIGVPYLLHPVFAPIFYSLEDVVIIEGKTNDLLQKLDNDEINFCVAPQSNKYNEIILYNGEYRKYGFGTRHVAPADEAFRVYEADVYTDNILSMRQLDDYEFYLPGIIKSKRQSLSTGIPLIISLNWQKERYISSYMQSFVRKVQNYGKTS